MAQDPGNGDELNTQEGKVKKLVELTDFELVIMPGPRFACKMFMSRNRDEIRYNFYKTGAFKYLTRGSSWSGTSNTIKQFPNCPFEKVFVSMLEGSRFRRLTIYNKNGPLELDFDATLFEYVEESITLGKILGLLTSHLQNTSSTIPALDRLPLPGADYDFDRAQISYIPETVFTTSAHGTQPPHNFAVHAWKSTNEPDDIEDLVSWYFFHRIAIYSDGDYLKFDFHNSDQAKLLRKTMKALAGDNRTSEVADSLDQISARELVVNNETMEAWIHSLKEEGANSLSMT